MQNISEIKILHIDSNHPILWELLQEAGFQNDQDFTSSKQDIEEKIQNYHGIVIRSRFKIDKQFIDKATNLQFIARVGAGLESIDCDYATSKNIQLIAAPEGNRNAVGEQSIGMLLSLFNNLNRADREIRNGQWNRESNRGHELENKTIGIIGYGNMGKAFAKKLRGFDVTVLCYDILPNVADNNAKQVSLEELQEKSDVLSLHIPWTETTDKMVNSNFINAFAKPFWLINTSRGKNIVTADLVEALESKKILGAALDVLEYEKLSFENLFESSQPQSSLSSQPQSDLSSRAQSRDQPKVLNYLLQADNVLLSPHIAGWTFESHEKLAQVIVDKIKTQYGLETNTEKPKAGVTGLGGVFFKAKNPTELKNWYHTHLNVPTDEYGWSFNWHDKAGSLGTTQWSTFAEDTTYFEPSEKQFMLNYRVENLEELLVNLKEKDITICGEMQTFSYGKFAWILDSEQNKIELWEPIDSAFQ